MLFQKSAPHVGRSAFAAKAKSSKFWTGSQNQQQQQPNFFVSTPQFNRHQQQQVQQIIEDQKNQNEYIDPYLSLTAGASNPAINHAYEEDEKMPYWVAKLQTPNFSHVSSTPSSAKTASLSSSSSTSASSSSYSLPELDVVQTIENIDSNYSIIDGVLNKMQRLQQAGSHSAVYDAFQSVDETQMPVEGYNLLLKSLNSTSDITTQLQTYERMLSIGVAPNGNTYALLVKSLIGHANMLRSTKTEFYSIFGAETMESISEVYENLAGDEYLLLAQQIVNAVVLSKSPIASSERFLNALNSLTLNCFENGIDVMPGLLAASTVKLPSSLRILNQTSIHGAVEEFSKLELSEQQRESTQIALLKSYFNFNEPQSALMFYSGCGAPAHLLKHLIINLAANNYVGTARRYSEENEVGIDVLEGALGAIPLNSAERDLPSALQMFYNLTSKSGGGGGNAGRCSFLNLCVASNRMDVLLMALKESKLVNASFDASTILNVCKFLAKDEPLLASDICTWQVSKLIKTQNEMNLKSYVAQELVSEVIGSLKQSSAFTLDTALRLLPVIGSCVGSKHEVLSMLTKSRTERPEEFATLMDSSRVLKVTSSLAKLILSTIDKLSVQDMTLAKELFPLLVSDTISHKPSLNGDEGIVREALMMYYPNSNLKTEFDTFCDTSNQSSNPGVSSIVIQRYALAPNGLDHAVEMLNSEVNLGNNVAPFAISSILQACIKNNAFDLINPLVESLPRSVENLNLLIAATAQINEHSLCMNLYDELISKFNVYPTTSTYTALFKSFVSKPKLVLKLFKDAHNAPNAELNSECYNFILQSLCRSNLKPEIENILTVMKSKQFEVTVQSYSHLINMYLKDNNGDAALTLLRGMPLVTKSLLDVRTFNQLMDFFVHTKPNRQSALEVFVDLRNTGTIATPYTYRLLMEAYLLRSGDEVPSIQHADKVLMMMKRDGAPITNQCFATLLRARGVIFKDFDGARDFYRGLVKTSRVLPDKGIFKALMESYIINGHKDESSHVFEEMKRYHVPVDDEIRGML